jgi:8-oxo-dGTP pyrophosphatase MutT (NUDIX family)
MPDARWKPNLTVAAIIPDGDRFLLVEEQAGGNTVFNQPAGHVEPNETLLDAIQRETLEETGWPFKVMGVVGIYRMHIHENDTTYVRVCFHGRLLDDRERCELDSDIIDTHWLTHEQIKKFRNRLRSPMVYACLRDYLAGRNYPLSVIKDLGDV